MTVINDVWEMYSGLQQAQPYIGSVITAVGTFSLSDVVSQLMKDKKVNWKKVGYTAALSPVYGSAIYGLIESGKMVGDYLIDHPLAKAALGPNLWGHALNAYLFVNNTVAEEEPKYSLKANLKHYASMFSKESLKNFGNTFKEKIIDKIPKKEYMRAFWGSMVGWNLFHWFNYSQVPDEMQTPLTLGVSVLWTTAITAWSLTGGRRIAYEKEST